jgi:methylmalonyl-CoA/ethylmalonyl-CoA epimerase
MPTVRRIDHIAIVVDDIEAGLGFWRDILGLEVSRVEEVAEQQAVVAMLPTGQSGIELVKPTDEESGAARFLRKRGPGMHHLCLEVDDLDGFLDRLKASGVRLITPVALTGSDGKRMAFIHPESTHGVLVELYEIPSKA